MMTVIIGVCNQPADEQRLAGDEDESMVEAKIKCISMFSLWLYFIRLLLLWHSVASCISGKRRRRIIRGQQHWWDKMAELAEMPFPERPEKKVFKPKCPELETLSDYSGGASKEFWEKFPENLDVGGDPPYKIDSSMLWRRSVAAGCPQLDLVEKVCKDISEGCSYRVNPQRIPVTWSKNAPSAIQEGEKVTDAIATWVKQRIVAGPFTSAPPDVIVNSIMATPKPTGAVRIIVNQSSPVGRSVNDHVDDSGWDYESRMGGIKDILRAINAVGKGALLAKIDWNNAYKHFQVDESNHRYNYFKWLDRLFVELCLVFGNINSVGIYDRGARCVKNCVLCETGFLSHMAIQHLDDLCAVGRPDTGHPSVGWPCGSRTLG